MFVIRIRRNYVRIAILTAFISLFLPALTQAQVTLSQWPAPLQLYPRDQTNQCTISIAGRLSSQDIKAVSLIVLRNQQPYRYDRAIIDPANGQFTFKPVIRAELAEYSFQLFTHASAGNRAVDGIQTGDSVQVALRDNIVCGDVFLIMGQSNAVGGTDPQLYRNEFCRSFGVNRLNTPYNPADTAWSLTNTSEGLNSLWGVELQRLITEQHGVPTAFINGGAPSTTIGEHTTRTESQPDNLNTLYGRLLYRARKAGVADRVRAMIWWQGEAEAQSNASPYVQMFPQLYRQWKLDYPGLQKVYHAQLNLLTNPVLNAGALRDYQRRSKEIFADNEPVATIGLLTYDGVHYGNAGHKQFGQELFSLIARDFYGSTDTSNIESPNIRRIFYRTPARDEVVLEFQPGQEMRWPADTTVINPTTGYQHRSSLVNFVYTDYPGGQSNVIKSVTEQGNRLIVKLRGPSNAQSLTYLPSYYKDAQTGYYAGPFIRNRRGIRALTFHQVPIAPPLPVATNLQAAVVDTSHIRLTWGSTSPNVEEWLIERADSTGEFKAIARIPGTAIFYDDLRRKTYALADSLQLDATYQYRVRALSAKAEADYSPVVTASLRLVLGLGELEEQAIVYPNPTKDQVKVQLPLGWVDKSVTLTLTNTAGLIVWRRHERVSASDSVVTASVRGLSAGLYVLSVEQKQAVLRCRLVVTH